MAGRVATPPADAGIVVPQAALNALEQRIRLVEQSGQALVVTFETGMVAAIAAALREGVGEGTELRGAVRDAVKATIEADPTIVKKSGGNGGQTTKPKVPCLGELNEAGDVVKECTSPSRDGMSLRGMFSAEVGHLALLSGKGHAHTPKRTLDYFGGDAALAENDGTPTSEFVTSGRIV